MPQCSLEIPFVSGSQIEYECVEELWVTLATCIRAIVRPYPSDTHPPVPQVKDLDTAQVPYIVDGFEPVKNRVTLNNHKNLSNPLD